MISYLSKRGGMERVGGLRTVKKTDVKRKRTYVFGVCLSGQKARREKATVERGDW